MPSSQAALCGLALGIVMLTSSARLSAQASIPIPQDGPPSASVKPMSQPMPAPMPTPGSVSPMSQPVPMSPPKSSDPVVNPPTALESVPSPYVRQVFPDGEAKPVGSRLVDQMPLPGSLEYELAQEYAAREQHRTYIWNGTVVQGFPTTLLWEPVFASKREPRMMAQSIELDNHRNTRTLDTSIGGVLGLWRIKPPGHDLAYQLDLFAGVNSRFSPSELIASDYRFGIPLTFRWADWHGKLAYEHTQSHLGDEFSRARGVMPINFDKDEVVFALAHDLFCRSLRIYGQVSYAFQQNVPGDPEPWRFDVGFQYVYPGTVGGIGSPFVAAHADFQGLQGYNPNINAQAGWLWRNPCQRLANVRIFAEYYRGRSPYGQFLFNREEFYGVGAALDF